MLVQHVLLHNNSNCPINRSNSNHPINPNSNRLSIHVLMAQTLMGLVNEQNNSNRTDRLERVDLNKSER
jgi:hypothetical protein